MKALQYKKWGRSLLAIGLVLSIIASCTIEGDNYTLAPIPTPSFEAVELSNGRVRLINTTASPAISHWTILNSGQRVQGDTVELNLIFEGTYDVKLDIVAQGGMASVTKNITITQRDPEACSDDNPLGFLASCTQKTWRLNPAPGALKVGPGPDNGEWWTSDMAALSARPCDFNDEYTFVFNSEGTFIYDNQGDFYADGYLGNRTFGCEPAENLSGDQAAWGAGTFGFSVSAGTGVRQLGQLTLIGAGAHIGVKKAQNGAEVDTGPIAQSVVYDILEMTKDYNGQGYDLLKIGVNIGGDAWWTFTLRSF